MFIVGFIKTDAPEVLINPVPCDTEQELYEWITDFLNEKDFHLETAITQENLAAALQAKKPIRVNFNGYKVALLLGEVSIIQDATERFLHTDFGLFS